MAWIVCPGGVERGEWQLLEGQPLGAGDQRCAHVVELWPGREVLPHAVYAETEEGYAASYVCYDCIQAAVARHFPHWEHAR